MAKIETLVDAFDGNSLNASLWNNFGPVSVFGGKVVVGAGIESSSSYQLTNSSVYVEIDSVTFPPDSVAITPLLLSTDSLIPAFVIYQGSPNTIRAQYGIFSSDAEVFSLTNYRFLRIIDDGSETRWERSSDGDTWIVMFDIPSISLDSCELLIGGGENGETITIKGVNTGIEDTTTPTIGTKYALPAFRNIT